MPSPKSIGLVLPSSLSPTHFLQIESQFVTSSNRHIRLSPLAFGRLKKPPYIITMPVEGVNGILNVESAALHAPQVGVANTNPQHILSVGSNLYVSGDSSDVLTVDGNVVCEGVKVGLIEITPSYDLAAVANVGNVTSNTIQFTNPDTGIVATGNVTIGSTLTVSGFRITAQAEANDDLEAITLAGADTNQAIHITNATDSESPYSGALQIGTNTGNNGGLGVAGNVHVGRGLFVDTDTLVVDSTNNRVGIGKTDPATALDVDGTVTATGFVGELAASQIAGTLAVTSGGTGTTTSTGTGSVVRSIAPTFTGTTTFSGEVDVNNHLNVTGNMFYTKPTSIHVDSNVVTEYTGPHSRDPTTPLLKKFPEIAFAEGKFDRNGTTNVYIQAGYVAESSSQYNTSETYAPWKAFNGISETSNNTFGEWLSGQDTYSGTVNNGAYNATRTIFESTPGEWIGIKMPKKIKLSKVSVSSRWDTGDARSVREYKLWASNDASDWYELATGTSTLSATSSLNTFDINVNITDYYSMFRLQVLSMNDNNGEVGVGEFQLYGYEEDPPAGDTSIDTTFTSIMNTPQTTGVKVYVDGNTLDNKVSGPDATGPSATYDSTGKYWELNGSLESNIAVEANTFLSGDQPHAVSVWFNSSNLEANVSNTCVFSISDQEHLNSENLDLQSNTWHNLTYAYQGEGGSKVTYLDGRKVAEDQAEDTFGAYPPFAMTGYSQGGYVVSGSDTGTASHSTGNYLIYDNDSSTIKTHGDHYNDSGSYNRSPPTNHGGNVLSGDAIPNGEWHKIQMPHKLILGSIGIRPRNSGYAGEPVNWYLYGSNDDVDWTMLYKKTDSVVPSDDYETQYTVNAASGLSYFLLIMTKSAGYGTVNICELNWYGHRENDLVRLPDPTNVLKYPHVALTGPAQRGYVVTESSALSGTEAYKGYNAFDEKTGDANSNFHWLSHNSYNSAGELSNTATILDVTTVPVSGSGTEVVEGEWIQVELPHKLLLSDIAMERQYTPDNDIYGPKRAPRDGALLGSNDGTTWKTIHKFTGLTATDWPANTLTKFNGTARFGTISTSSPNYVAYKYFRLVVQKTNPDHPESSGNAVHATIREIQLYGTGVDSVPIQIGGGNIDKVANFRVYDKFVGEDQALEIWDAQKDTFRGVKNSVTLHKGRLGIGTTEPEGRLAVLDEPHNLEEFPPRAMTANETHMEGYGVFKASASSTWSSYNPWEAFDENNPVGGNTGAGAGWASSGPSTSYDTYDGSTGEDLGITSHHTNSVTGEWIQIQLPVSIILSSIDIESRSETSYNASGYDHGYPKDVVLYGSSDGSSWSTVKSFTTVNKTASEKHTEAITSSTAYKYYALVVESIHVTSSTSVVWCTIGQLRLFGTREQGQSVLHDGQLTLTKSLTVPRIGPALDADDTPRRDRLVVEYNTSTNPTFEGAVRDTSGRGLDAILRDATYDATDKSIRVGTSQDIFLTQGIPGKSGDVTNVSYSIWFKADDVSAANQIIMTQISAYAVGVGLTLALNTNELQFGFGYAYSSGQQLGGAVLNAISAGQWYHVVAIKKGSGTLNATTLPNILEIYINGEKKTLSHGGGTGTLNVGTEHWLIIGAIRKLLSDRTNEEFIGNVSSIKYYDCALTAEEVKTLYDMGRCDEGHHVVNFSKTRVGIGLGDGEAPRAALDVSGGMSRGMFTINQASGTWTEGIALRFLQYGTSDLWDLSIASPSDDNFVFGYNGASRGYFRWDGSNTIQNFTGQHRTFIKDVPFSQASDLEGLIVSSDQNKYIKMSGGIEAGSNAITTNESLPIVSLSTTTNDKKCFGVISASEDPEERSDAFGSFVTPYEKEKGDTRVYINSVGEGAIWVSNIGGNLEAGDYITTSNVAGYGQKQTDDVLHNYTVAKITMDCDFNPATQPVQQILRSNVVETYYLGNVHKVKSVPHEFVTTVVGANDDWSNVSVSPSDVTYAEWSNLEANTQNTYTLTYTQTSNVVYDVKYTLTTTANVTESDPWDRVSIDPPTVTYAEYSNLEANTQNTYTLTFTQTTTDTKTPEEWSALESNTQSLYNMVYYQSVEEEVASDYPGATTHTRVTDRIENELDEHGQIQWEDHPTETEKAYKIRYLDVSGAQTDSANAVHIAAFVGCTYHCG